MRARLSVVIPTLDAAAGLSRSLPVLAEGLTTGLVRELVIADGGSTDATPTIADAAGAILVRTAPSRGGQLRAGAAAASGDWLLFLHADTVLPPGWTRTVAAHIEISDRPAFFSLRFDAPGRAARAVALWANLRARLFRLPYGDQGLLVARAEYHRIGGHPDIPLMEDVALARALGRRLKPLPLTVTTSAEKYLRDGWLRRGARNLSLLVRFLCGADPHALARRY